MCDPKPAVMAMNFAYAVIAEKASIWIHSFFSKQIQDYSQEYKESN